MRTKKRVGSYALRAALKTSHSALQVALEYSLYESPRSHRRCNVVKIIWMTPSMLRTLQLFLHSVEQMTEEFLRILSQSKFEHAHEANTVNKHMKQSPFAHKSREPSGNTCCFRLRNSGTNLPMASYRAAGVITFHLPLHSTRRSLCIS